MSLVVLRILLCWFDLLVVLVVCFGLFNLLGV